MTWELEEAGDDAVTLHREDGLVLSATRVADDGADADRAHRWTEWRFAVADGDGGEQLTEHGWEIVDEEHLWEVLDGFTHRFRRKADAGTADDEGEAAATTDEEAEDDAAARNDPNATAARDRGDGQVSAPDSTDSAEHETDDDAEPSDGDAPSTTDSVPDEPSTDDATAAAADARAAGDDDPDADERTVDDANGTGRRSAGDDIAPSTGADAAGEPVTDSGETAAPADEPDVTYRPARPADAAELATVYRNAYAENRELGFPAKAESATADEVREWIDAHGLLVAVAGDDVVGGVRLEETDPARVKLSRLAVHDDWKGEGIGSELLARAEAAVSAGNGETVWLTTPEAHPFLPELYRERGYERTGDYPLEYRDYDEIVMEKRVG